jgi:Rrf2 family protein
VKLNAKTRYGIRAMLEIAMNNSQTGVFQKDIAERQEISLKYLDHIIHALKTAMLVRNVKGKKSGYILCKSPEKISLYDIYQAFEPAICVVDCLSDNEICDRSGKCSSQGVYGNLNQLIINYLQGITLQDLINKELSLNPDKEIKAPISVYQE